MENQPKIISITEVSGINEFNKKFTNLYGVDKNGDFWIMSYNNWGIWERFRVDYKLTN